jgi:hypothetical protein
MDINPTELYISDYKDLKKHISATEAEIEAQNKAATPRRRFTFQNSNFSFTGVPSPAPPSGSDGGTTAVRFRQQGSNNQTTPGDKAGRSSMIGGFGRLSYLANNNVGWSTSREGGYGDLGSTYRLDRNTSDSQLEMIPLPPIKSVDDFGIDSPSPTPEVVEKTDPSQQILLEIPDKLQVCYVRLQFLYRN